MNRNELFWLKPISALWLFEVSVSNNDGNAEPQGMVIYSRMDQTFNAAVNVL